MQATVLQPKPASSLNSLGGPARFARAVADPGLDAGGQSGAGFAQALQTAQTAGTAPAAGAALSRTVVAGDTLSEIVREQAATMGVKLEGGQTYRLAQQLAKANRIDNPDRIFAGQQLDMRALSEQIAQTASASPVKPFLAANLPAQQALQLPASKRSAEIPPRASADVVAQRSLPRFPHVPTPSAVAPTES